MYKSVKRRKLSYSMENLSASNYEMSFSSKLSHSQSLRNLRDTSTTVQSDKLKVDNVSIDKAFASFKNMELAKFDLMITGEVVECVKQVAANVNKKLNQNTAEKLRNIVDNWEVEKYIKLGRNCTDFSMQILGINLSEEKLSFVEKNRIKQCVDELLQTKLERIVQICQQEDFNLEKESEKDSENGVRDRFMTLSGFKDHHLEWKINTLFEKYEEMLMICHEKMKQWKCLKERTSNLNFEKACNLNVQAKVTELKAKMTNLLCQIKMFKETPKTVDGFKQLSKILDEELELAKKQIYETKILKEQYDKLRGTDYDDILSNYRLVNNAVEKQLFMLEKM